MHSIKANQEEIRSWYMFDRSRIQNLLSLLAFYPKIYCFQENIRSEEATPPTYKSIERTPSSKGLNRLNKD